MRVKEAQTRQRVTTDSATRRDLLKIAAAVPFVPALPVPALPAASSLPATAITLDRFPYLQDVGSDHAVVMWTTRQRGAGTVEFSSDRSFSRNVPAMVREFLPAETGRPVPFYQYAARLTGLREGIQYFYRAMVDGENLTPAPSVGEELRFRTAARGPVSFLAFGDSGEGSAQQERLANLMGAEDVNLILHAGDIAYPDGTYQEFEALYFAVYRDILSRIPVFLCPGNHDYYSPGAAPYLALTSHPVSNVSALERGRFYSFDWGDIHFVSLDTNDPLERAIAGTGSMFQWLEDDLRRTRKFWRIVFFHHPPYPTSLHHENNEVSVAVRRHLVPILERHGVPLVIAGHDHNYQRAIPLRGGVSTPIGTGTQYVVTGGGGTNLFSLPGSPIVAKGAAVHHYMRFDVDGSTLTMRAKGLDGAEFDRAVVAPVPAVGEAAVVNAASYSPAVAPGTLITISGRSLAYREEQATAFPLPSSLLGVRVSINGQAIPLTYVSPDQINAQIPFTVSGNVTLVVTTPNGSASTAFAVTDTAPGIFFGGAPAIIHATGALVTAAAPALPGEFISIFLTGLGRVNSAISAGQASPSAPLASAVNPVEVRLGGVLISPTFAGLAPGYAGLYQVVVQIPAGTRSGTYPLEVMSRGAMSNSVSLPVGPASTVPAEGEASDQGLAELLHKFSVPPRT